MKGLVLVAGIMCMQDGIARQGVFDQAGIPGTLMQTISHSQYEITGSVLLSPEFLPGTLELLQNRVYDDILINYDAYSDNVIVSSEKTGLMEIDKALVAGFSMTEEDYRHVFFRKNVEGKSTFLLTLLSDSVSFYCRIKKKVESNAKRNNSEKRSEIQTTLTYFVERNGNLLKVRPTRKAMLAAFPNHKNGLSKYLQENKVDFDNYREVAAALSYAFSD